MITHISLVIALCSHLSMGQIQSQMKDLQSHNPDSKITLRLDQKATCDASGNVIKKEKSKKVASK